jgi:hypothetical protein
VLRWTHNKEQTRMINQPVPNDRYIVGFFFPFCALFF